MIPIDRLRPVPFPNNMGMVRYFMALCVVVAHYCELAGWDYHFPVDSYTAVGGFFALSGFLVYGSYVRRRSLKDYIRRRGRRILPPYFATVVLFAFFLSSVSTLSIPEYFTSGHFYRYLAANLSFLNFLEPTLPGVFGDSTIHAVNASLWTMKVEWCLYLTVPAVVWLIWKLRANDKIVFGIIYVLSAAYRVGMQHLYEITDNEIYDILGRQFMGQLMYFYAGVLLYFILDIFLKRRYLFAGAALAIVCVGDYIPEFRITLYPAAVAVLVLFVSFTGKWGTWEGKHDNISYNIYLVHFPVIQLCIYLGFTQSIGPFPGFLASLGITVAVAALINAIASRVGGRSSDGARRGRR